MTPSSSRPRTTPTPTRVVTPRPLVLIPVPVLLVLAPAPVAAAAGAAAPPSAGTPEDRSTEFVAVEGGTETTSAEALLITAYFVMWAALLGFVFMTWRRQARLEARLEGIQAELGRLGPGPKG